MTLGGWGSMSGASWLGGLDGGIRAQVGSQDAITPQTIQPLVPGSLERPELGTVSVSPEVEESCVRCQLYGLHWRTCLDSFWGSILCHKVFVCSTVTEAQSYPQGSR